jgi:hypothetical protein
VNKENFLHLSLKFKGTTQAFYKLDNAEVVAANRYGEILPIQYQALYKTWNGGLLGLSLAMLLALIAACSPLIITTFLVHDPSLTAQVAWLPFLFVPIAMIPFAWRWINFFSIKRELTKGQINQALGQIRWKRRKYVAKLARHTAKPLFNTLELGLPPGTYRFFYLPKSKLLLAAERQWGGSLESNLLGPLFKVWRFNSSDLVANRMQRLSRKQKQKLLTLALLQLVGCLVAAAILALTIPLLISLDAFNDLGNLLKEVRERELGWTAGVLLVGILALVWGLVGLLSTARLWANLRKGIVKSVSGVATKSFKTKLEIHAGEGRTEGKYFYELGGKKFEVSLKQYTVLIPQLNYRLYYLPQGEKILSIEPLT